MDTVNIHITVRNSRITDQVKEYITDKLEKIEKFSHKNIDVNVILDIQKYRSIAEVNVKTNLTTIHCTEEDTDMMVVCDRVVDRINRQMRKSKERVQHHRGEANLHEVEQMLNSIGSEKVVADTPIYAHNIEHENLECQEKSIDEAVSYLKSHRTSLLLFINSESKKYNILYQVADGEFELFEQKDHQAQGKGSMYFIKHLLYVTNGTADAKQIEIKGFEEFMVDFLTPDQAADFVKEKEYLFHFFLNRNNGKICMLQSRKNGSFGLFNLTAE
ncbi:MAG: ribosome-associated translation inhibitor RaiA [Candidatus Auribacter fodinae]|uniref:Ribosome hibernation promoting factor n=1 Tax=Candidatus Auribacter fodinae TaxID=2093366 RepID=A0A3A4R5B3_9BACT|nr:MAG: ribosome-associated translation inhibitor RaiA [Candidatus Auribacter fodinae]